ncbi:MAG TPA: phosphoribosyltransferase family protein [Jatrophihabitantaceae bacterium]|nr:phosphoribosyltransferase family protein [Jatrophihabitantaceae bacterium]
MSYADRADAGRRLAVALRDHDLPSDPVVIGLPRGGVVVAAEVARALSADLDIVVVRKVGAPHQTELAMGAVGEGGEVVRNERVIDQLGIDDWRFAQAVALAQAEADRRARSLRGDHPPIEVAGRTAIVVDDGIATGSTARVACQVVRQRGATRIVLAAPVAPAEAERRFADVADDVCFLQTPRSFMAVGQFYADFTQVSDREVGDLLG